MKNFILFAFVFLMIGCQSAVKNAQEAGQGHFRGRALIKDKAKSKSFIVNLSFNVQKGKVIRLDATSPLNQHLASFLITPSELSYFIVPEKTFYKGTPQAKSFARFMAVPLDPMSLENLVFRTAFTNKDWTCDQDASTGMLMSCFNLREKMKVNWSENKDKKLVVDVDHPQGQIQINFHRIQPKVEEGVSLTTLEIPKDFRQIK